MKTNKRMTFFLGGAAFLMLGVVAVPSSKKPSAEPSAPVAAHPAVEPVAAPAPAPLPVATREELERQADRGAALTWGRDPFAALSPGSVGPTGRPVLNGISLRGEDAWAIIGEELVQVGEKIVSGYQVVAIDATSVTLERDNEKITLRLGENHEDSP